MTNTPTDKEAVEKLVSHLRAQGSETLAIMLLSLSAERDALKADVKEAISQKEDAEAAFGDLYHAITGEDVHLGERENHKPFVQKAIAAQAAGTFSDGVGAAAENLEDDAHLLDEIVARKMGEGLPVNIACCEFTAERLRRRAASIRALTPSPAQALDEAQPDLNHPLQLPSTQTVVDFIQSIFSHPDDLVNFPAPEWIAHQWQRFPGAQTQRDDEWAMQLIQFIRRHHVGGDSNRELFNRFTAQLKGKEG